MKKDSKLIVHMVGNAHLDPAWLWPWAAGVDEALATCRTACDLLDDYPELHVTRGEAWVHDQVQRIDPGLFKRIAAHVKSGRWNVVNGWWIQPDCNLPTPESFLKESEIGGKYFQENLGIKVNVGYNVDSFGHCAMLPTFLRQGGKDAYVFSRPGELELKLPSSLFRWRSPAGDEVLAFRLAGYGSPSVFDLQRLLDVEIGQAPKGVGHTLCFYGIGDHGGGPTRDQIEWIIDHKNYAAGVELRLSDCAAFFRAVKSQKASLPIVNGELNPHAVGCYTVVRDIKREGRRAEVMLQQAHQVVVQGGGGKDRAVQKGFEEAWRSVLFNQFHDIMGGSSIKSVCTQSLEELGAVKYFARDLIVQGTRMANVDLPPCQRQRMVIDNPSTSPWEGYAEFNPYFPPDGAPEHFSLQDSDGAPLLFQAIPMTYPGHSNHNILFPVKLPAGGRQIVEIRRLAEAPAAGASTLRCAGQTISNATVSLTCGSQGITSLALKGKSLLGAEGIRVSVFEDQSDTWSHGLLVYEGKLLEAFAAREPWAVIEGGPIRASLHNMLYAQDGKLRWTVQLLDGGRAVRLRLSLNWWGTSRIVKLIIPPGFQPTIRRDGTPGTIIARALDGREYPIMDLISVATKEGGGASLTAVSPDIYSTDVQPDGTMRLTLLRCPAYSHHDPAKYDAKDPYPVTDQGVHDYEIDLIPDTAFHDQEALAAAQRLNFPLWISETTKGMPAGWRYDSPPQKAPNGMPPVPPLKALMPADLLANAPGARLVRAETLCEKWAGEQLLVSKGSTLKLQIPIPVEAKYRVCLSRLVGKGFGAAQLLLDGRLLATLPDVSGQPRPQLDALPDPILLNAGRAGLELKGASRVALGFLHATPIYTDIPASAWMVAGPFVYSNEQAANPHEHTDRCLQQVEYPPEKARDFDAPFTLCDGSEARWQKPAGNNDFVDFQALTGHKVGSIHFAATHIWSEKARTARLSFGVDYWARIWLNGRMLTPCIVGVGASYKGQLNLDIPLEKGWNELLLKIASGNGGNGFWMAISDPGTLKFAARVVEAG